MAHRCEIGDEWDGMSMMEERSFSCVVAGHRAVSQWLRVIGSDDMSIEERGFFEVVAHLRAVVSAPSRLHAVFFPRPAF
jgi:hypothetical protein